jgi:predicted aspartyl protease
VYEVNRLQLKDGLLYTSVSLHHEGKCIVVDNVIIDTGAFHTIIAPYFLEKLEVAFSDEDELVKASGYGGTISYSVRKSIDSIECEDIKINNMRLDFGEIDPNERVNGLIGLDFLRKAEVILDLVDLVMFKKST